MADPRIQVNIRLPQSLIDRIEKYLAENKPAVRDRTQLIEIALEKIIGPR